MYRGITKPNTTENNLSAETYDPTATTMSIVQPAGTGSGKTMNINRYATKKTIAQGMLDIALLTANASQLRYILTLGHEHQFYDIMLGLIITSIILQVFVGVIFLIIGAIDINLPENHSSAEVLNNVTIAIIFLITVLNVVINAFGIEHTNRIPAGTVIKLRQD